MYKHHTKQLPQNFTKYFTRYDQIHNYPTRNAHNYNVTKTKKTFSDRAIRNCGPNFWNSLDKSIKQCSNTKDFKNKLRSNLLSDYK